MEALSNDAHPRGSLLDVHFRACWEVIDDTRAFLVRALAHLVRDPVRLEQIGIAAHELMENAFRYSDDSEVNIRIEVDADTARITVDNHASPARLAQLEEQIASLRAEPDAFVYYQQKMLESVGREDGSGLGLARIQYECELALEFDVDAARVRVSAVGPITSSPTG